MYLVQSKLKARQFILLAIGLIILLNIFLYTRGAYAAGGDYAFPVLSAQNLYGYFFVFNTYNYSGLANTTSSIIWIFLYSIALIINFIGGYLAASTFLIWIFPAIGGIGMFLLVATLLKNYPIKSSYTGAFLATIIFTINFDSYLGQLNQPAAFLPYVFLAALLFFEELEKGKLNLGHAAIAALSLGALLAAGGISYLLQNTLFLALGAIALLLLTKKHFALKYAKSLSIIAILAILMNSSWLITTVTFPSAYKNQITNSAYSAEALNANALTLLQSILAFGTWLTPNSTTLNIFLLLTLFSILAIGMFGVFYDFRSKDLSDTRKHIMLVLIVEYLFFVAVATSIRVPFGLLYQNLLTSFNPLYVLRYSYTATHYLLIFVIATLFGVGCGKIFNKHYKGTNHLKDIIAITFVIVVIISYIYFFDYTAILQQQSAGVHPVSSIPAHVSDVTNYINMQKGLFSVATLPIAVTYQIDTWYTSADIYSSLINHPVYTGGFVASSEQFFPPSKYIYYADIGLAIDTTINIMQKLSNLFGVFGIRYIIVQGDTSSSSTCGFCYTSPFSFNDIYTNLNKSTNILLLKKYQNTSVYQNSNYVPLVYTGNIENLGDASYSLMLSLIGSASFDIQDTLVYSTQNGGLYNSIGKFDAFSIPRFRQPSVSFIQNSPTKVTAHITNATTPYYLVFRETYDPHWAAFYSNGTMVNESRHIQVNGFANAWYMNKTGNYTVTLYYTLQTYAWIAWGISFAALFVTIGIGVYGWKESKKHSKLKHKLVRA